MSDTPKSVYWGRRRPIEKIPFPFLSPLARSDTASTSGASETVATNRQGQSPKTPLGPAAVETPPPLLLRTAVRPGKSPLWSSLQQRPNRQAKGGASVLQPLEIPDYPSEAPPTTSKGAIHRRKLPVQHECTSTPSHQGEAPVVRDQAALPAATPQFRKQQSRSSPPLEEDSRPGVGRFTLTGSASKVPARLRPAAVFAVGSPAQFSPPRTLLSPADSTAKGSSAEGVDAHEVKWSTNLLVVGQGGQPASAQLANEQSQAGSAQPHANTPRGASTQQSHNHPESEPQGMGGVEVAEHHRKDAEEQATPASSPDIQQLETKRHSSNTLGSTMLASLRGLDLVQHSRFNPRFADAAPQEPTSFSKVKNVPPTQQPEASTWRAPLVVSRHGQPKHKGGERKSSVSRYPARRESQPQHISSKSRPSAEEPNQSAGGSTSSMLGGQANDLADLVALFWKAGFFQSKDLQAMPQLSETDARPQKKSPQQLQQALQQLQELQEEGCHLCSVCESARGGGKLTSAMTLEVKQTSGDSHQKHRTAFRQTMALLQSPKQPEPSLLSRNLAKLQLLRALQEQGNKFAALL